jgi:hypothetical protein
MNLLKKILKMKKQKSECKFITSQTKKVGHETGGRSGESRQGV